MHDKHKMMDLAVYRTTKKLRVACRVIVIFCRGVFVGALCNCFTPAVGPRQHQVSRVRGRMPPNKLLGSF